VQETERMTLIPDDRRPWWQKLADGIAEALTGILRLLIELWKACN